MQVTVFVDVLSHWCLAASPALVALRDTLADDLRLELRFAPIGDGAPIGFSHEGEAWFYGRGTLAYATKLTAAWYENEQTTTWHANAAVAAAVAAGAEPIALAAATSRAAMVRGRLLGREDEAIHTVADLSGVDADALREAMHGETVPASLHAANVELTAIGCTERPSWELVNDNGDRAVLQGVWQVEAILPLVHALLGDERAYERAGPPPQL